MPLTIGVKPEDYFTIDGVKCYVTKVLSWNSFSIIVSTGSMDYEHAINDKVMSVLAPFNDVKVSAGFHRPGVLSLVIDAPPNRKILRSKFDVEDNDSG